MPSAENPSINDVVELAEALPPEAVPADSDDDFVVVDPDAVPVPVAAYALRNDLTLEQRSDFVLALINYVTRLRQNGEIYGGLNLADVLVRYVTDSDDEAVGKLDFEYRGQEPLDFDITSPSPSHQHSELTRKDCESLIGIYKQTFIELCKKIEWVEKTSECINDFSKLIHEKQMKESEILAIKDYEALSSLTNKIRKEIKMIQDNKTEIESATIELRALNNKLHAIEELLDPKYGKIPSFTDRIQLLEGEIQALEEKIKAAEQGIQERNQQTADNSITEEEEKYFNGLDFAAKRAISPMTELSNIIIFLETKDAAKIPKRTRQPGPEPTVAQSYGVMTGAQYFQTAERRAKKPATKTPSPPPEEMTAPQDGSAETTYEFQVRLPGVKP